MGCFSDGGWSGPMKRFGESVEGIASVGVGASTHYPHPRIDPYTYTHYTHRWARAVQPSNTPGLAFSCTRRQASPVCICAYVYVCVCVRDGLDARCVYIMCVYAPPPLHRPTDQPKTFTSTHRRGSSPGTSCTPARGPPAPRSRRPGTPRGAETSAAGGASSPLLRRLLRWRRRRRGRRWRR